MDTETAGYRFAEFELSVRERVLRRQGVPLPLIPRYFDLLVLLIARRPAVVTRREIFEVVWQDVIVSDGALTQAIRTLRRTLDDQSREPRFIRTVSRHGYSFVFDAVEETPIGDVSITPSPGYETERRGAPLPVVPAAAATTRQSIRWARATASGAAAGLMAGTIGGALLWASPASSAAPSVVAVLGLLGSVAGALATVGVTAGMALADARSGSHPAAIVTGGALAGTALGVIVNLLATWTVEGLFGLTVTMGGPAEGVCLGAAAAAGHVLSRRGTEGVGPTAGLSRIAAAGVTAGCCALAAFMLGWAGRPLVGGTIHALAQASAGATISLAPLGALLGEPSFGPLTRALVAAFEGAFFGMGLACGLTSPTSLTGAPDDGGR